MSYWTCVKVIAGLSTDTIKKVLRSDSARFLWIGLIREPWRITGCHNRCFGRNRLRVIYQRFHWFFQVCQFSRGAWCALLRSFWRMSEVFILEKSRIFMQHRISRRLLALDIAILLWEKLSFSVLLYIWWILPLLISLWWICQCMYKVPSDCRLCYEPCILCWML